MNAPGCERIALADLTDYAAGELPETEAAAIEEHLFSCADCGARAAEFDALVRAMRPAVRSAEVGGFVTDAVLNRLAREGVRVRSVRAVARRRRPVRGMGRRRTDGAAAACRLWRRQRGHAVAARRRHRGASARRGRSPPARTVRSSYACRPPGSGSCRSWRSRCSSPRTKAMRSARSAATRSSTGDRSTVADGRP